MRVLACLLLISFSSLLITACGSDNDKSDSTSAGKAAPLHYRYSLKATTEEYDELQNQLTLQTLNDDKVPLDNVELNFSFDQENKTLNLRPSKALAEETCYRLIHSEEVNIDERCTGLSKKVKDINYRGNEIQSYTDYRDHSQYAHVNEVGYKDAGADGTWFNTDDSIDYYGYRVQSENLYVYFSVFSSGYDETWFTLDDDQGIDGVVVTSNENILSRETKSSVLFVDNTTDYMLYNTPFSSDTAYYTEFLNDALYYNSFYIRPALIGHPGKDHLFFTEDDLKLYWGEEISIEGIDRRVNYYEPQDNGVEALVSYTHFAYEDQLLVEERMYGNDARNYLDNNPNFDKNNPIKVIRYFYDQENKLESQTIFYSDEHPRKIYFGNILLNSITKYKDDETTTLEFAVDGKGIDGEWFTDDDIIKNYQISSDTLYAKGNDPGEDQLWFTDDDQLEYCSKTLVLHPDEQTTQTYRLDCTRIDDEIIPETHQFTRLEQRKERYNEWGQLVELIITDPGTDMLLGTVDDNIRTVTYKHNDQGYPLKTTSIHKNSSSITHFETIP